MPEEQSNLKTDCNKKFTFAGFLKRVAYTTVLFFAGLGTLYLACPNMNSNSRQNIQQQEYNSTFQPAYTSTNESDTRTEAKEKSEPRAGLIDRIFGSSNKSGNGLEDVVGAQNSCRKGRILCSCSTIIKETPRPICAFRLFTMNQSGDDMQQIQIPNLEDYLQLTDSVPFWNGRKVLFSTEMELCSINYDGTDMKKLTNFSEQFNNRTDKMEGPKFIDAFSISPDDDQIAFTKGGILYAMNSDGSNIRTLKERSPSAKGISWAPNGKQIALADSHLSVMNLNTYEIKTLTSSDNSTGISGRCWSSDSKRIVFLSYNFDKLGINVINADGTARRQLAEFSTCQESPTWSADNRKILFVSFKGMASELYTIDVETKDINKITFTGGTIKNSYFIP